MANACALSEVWFGDSDGVHDLVVVNVSEGIGTGIFANGQLLRGANGMAGEFGHVQMEPMGPRCGCGGRGCWETVGSNRAGLRYYEEFSGTAAPQSFAALVKMAQADDVHAIKALEKMSSFLGRGPAHDRLCAGSERDRHRRRYYDRVVHVRPDRRGRTETKRTLEGAEAAAFF